MKTSNTLRILPQRLLPFGVIGLSLFFLGVMTLGTRARALDLDVAGWAPAENLKIEGPLPLWLGDDGIVGRLACPSIVRMEGPQLKNAPLLLKSNPLVERQGAGEKWTLTLRAGLRWWNGDPVDGTGLAEWLKASLPKVVNEKLGTTVPSNLSIEASGPLSAKITWPTSPAFGPFVLSGVSLSREKGGATECAGLYAVKQSGTGIVLTINKGYEAKYSTIRVAAGSLEKVQGNHRLEFSLPRAAAHAAANSITTPTCAAELDIPLITAIVWNPSSSLASSAALRTALTMATPRGEIVRTGAGGLGTLLSAPILRTHPGYSAAQLVRPYSLEAAGQILEQAGFPQVGFAQGHIGQPRQKTADKPAYLRIARINGGQELIEKIIIDSFASLGIKVDFESVAAGGPMFDGALLTTFVSWTSQDIRGLAHSSALKSTAKPKAPFPFEGVSGKSLDEALDNYSLATTLANPDVKLLQSVHEKWFELEPWTVLMAHQYCLNGEGVKISSKVSVLDPDWFRRLAVE